MSRFRSNLHRLLLAIGAIILVVAGSRLLFDTAGYVDGKDNLTPSPDLHSELRALGALFVGSGFVIAAGAAVLRFRHAATWVGTVALLPQGIARLVSYSVDEGQHESYLRAGILETVLGLVFAYFLIGGLTGSADRDQR